MDATGDDNDDKAYRPYDDWRPLLLPFNDIYISSTIYDTLGSFDQL